jgi:hypothetical protein
MSWVKQTHNAALGGGYMKGKLETREGHVQEAKAAQPARLQRAQQIRIGGREGRRSEITQQQPSVAGGDGVVVSCEACVRWAVKCHSQEGLGGSARERVRDARTPRRIHGQTKRLKQRKTAHIDGDSSAQVTSR